RYCCSSKYAIGICCSFFGKAGGILRGHKPLFRGSFVITCSCNEAKCSKAWRTVGTGDVANSSCVAAKSRLILPSKFFSSNLEGTFTNSPLVKSTKFFSTSNPKLLCKPVCTCFAVKNLFIFIIFTTLINDQQYFSFSLSA